LKRFYHLALLYHYKDEEGCIGVVGLKIPLQIGLTLNWSKTMNFNVSKVYSSVTIQKKKEAVMAIN